MNQALFGMMLMPVCAILAGGVTWATSSRKHALSDGELIRHFLVIHVISVMVAIGISRTDAMRMHLDPVYRTNAEIKSSPVLAAMKGPSITDYNHLHYMLMTKMYGGTKTLDEAMREVRPELHKMANRYSGFSDQSGRMAWAQIAVDSLRELQEADPELCYRAMTKHPPEYRYSEDNFQVFQQAVIKVYGTSIYSRRHVRSPNDEPHVEFNAAAREYYAIRQGIETKYGRRVSELLTRKVLPDTPGAPMDTLCQARIEQLDTMLERPQAMASMLTDSVLR